MHARLTLCYRLQTDLSSKDVENGEQAGDSHFTTLPLSDWRDLPCDPPEVDPNLQRDPKAVVTNLLAQSGASKEHRKHNQQQAQQAIANAYLQQSAADKALVGDRLITDRKKWAQNIVALTHCLHKFQKLTQVGPSTSCMLVFLSQLFKPVCICLVVSRTTTLCTLKAYLT